MMECTTVPNTAIFLLPSQSARNIKPADRRAGGSGRKVVCGWEEYEMMDGKDREWLQQN